MIREVSPNEFAPLEVHLKHAPPGATAAHETYFGCPVAFESELDALLISTETLALPNRLGDEGITHFLLNHLDKELQWLESERSLAQSVHDAIVRSLSEGVPKAPALARRLGLSERTLQRRLADEGLSFQKLVDEARRELAEGLLVQSDYSLAEVAFLTGFSEQSAFNRAFRRWQNQTPATYRQAAQVS
jgi:AraC-like DNA-binding protein